MEHTITFIGETGASILRNEEKKNDDEDDQNFSSMNCEDDNIGGSNDADTDDDCDYKQ